MEKIDAEMQYSERFHETYRIRKLIEAWGEGNGRAQREACRTLEAIGEPAVGALIHALLHSDNSTIRWRAAEALGHTGDPRAIEPLIRSMGDRNTAVQWRAIEALVDIGEPAMESLLLVSKNGNVEVRWGATRAIEDIQKKYRLQENERYRARVEQINAKAGDSDEISMEETDSVMCSVCGKEPAVNYGYCAECSGRKGFS